MPGISFKQLSPTSTCPTRADEGSAGFDLYADTEMVLQPEEFKLVSLGIATSFPAYMVGFICPRSGLAAKHGVTVLNAPGVIDADFRGELGVILINLGDEDFVVRNGDRIAQLVVEPQPAVVVKEVGTLHETDRGAGGDA